MARALSDELSLKGGGLKVLDETQRSGPRVLTVRMSGRFVPFAASAMVFAILPFISASTPDDGARAAVVLAAGDRAAVDTAVDGVQSARDALTGSDSTVAAIAAAALGGGADPAGMGVSSAVGGGLVFPEIELTPLAAMAVVAPVAAGVPGFIHPVPGIEVSGFGPRIHPLLHRPMFHTGIDLQAACGTPIRAAASGTVVYARVSNSWGLRTMIQHTPTLKTAYGHQSKFLVKEGDVVKQGQVIGLVGTTGWSTGCHLHFDVIVNDHYVDPAPYLGFPASTSGPSSYGMVPNYFPGGGSVMTTAPQTVPDGDVPFSDVDQAEAGHEADDEHACSDDDHRHTRPDHDEADAVHDHHGSPDEHDDAG